jgi:HD-GYP domain-containing protein (c-di-GMP phosphodiesterase class II)
MLVGALCDHADAVFADLDSTRTWPAVIAAEPALGVRMNEAEFDRALVAVADFVDLKSPYTLGHGRAVAELTTAAAQRLDLRVDQVTLLRRAALVHGFGRLGVSNSIWDKPGPLGAGEWERVRLYPHLTERMLQQSPLLAPIGAVAVLCHERLDGSGYPRQLSGSAIGPLGRVLAAAQSYRTKLEERPHRVALAPADAAAFLRAEVSAGRLDAAAVAAVLEVAGHRPRRAAGTGAAPNRPDGLTDREVDVLRLLARGLSSRQIATRLVIAHKTVRNHVEHIYTKVDVTNRAAASLYAVQHGLLDEPGD